MEKIKVIFDTDIGDDIDDAFALLTLLNSEKIDLLGVTTVFRNSVDRAKMAKYIINTLHKNVECYAGIDDPIIQDVNTLNPVDVVKKEKYNSKGKYILPQWNNDMSDVLISNVSAIDFIIDMVHKYPNEVVLLATGPFTNVAAAFKKDPSIITLVKEVRIMGGRVYESTPVEWNIKCDPEAANIMYSSGTLLYCVGINVTENCILPQYLIKKLKSSTSKSIAIIYEMMEKWFSHYSRNNPTMHDPIAACSLLDDIVTFTKEKVFVELNGEKRGETIISEKGNYIYVAKSLNNDKFFALFTSLLNI